MGGNLSKIRIITYSMNTTTYLTAPLRRFILLLLLVSISCCLGARTMVFFNNIGVPPFINPAPSAYNNPANWSGGYPGATIAAGDVVIIKGLCEFNISVTNNGTIKLERDLLFFGNYTLKVMPGVTFTNNGSVRLGVPDVAYGWFNQIVVHGSLNNVSYNGIFAACC